jgi:hypothetical protein
MSPHQLPERMNEAPWQELDPGDGESILVGHRFDTFIPIVTGAGAETRTLAAPQKAHQRITLCMQTDGGGDCTITVTNGHTGNTSVVLNDAGDTVTLQAIYVGSTLTWRVMVNQGATVS